MKFEGHLLGLRITSAIVIRVRQGCVGLDSGVRVLEVECLDQVQLPAGRTSMEHTSMDLARMCLSHSGLLRTLG